MPKYAWAKSSQYTFEVGESHIVVDVETFDLVKDAESARLIASLRYVRPGATMRTGG